MARAPNPRPGVSVSPTSDTDAVICSHGPRTWELPVRDPFGALISPQAGPVVAAPAAAEGAAAYAAGRGDAAAEGVPQRQQRQRRRVPLSHDAVSELRATLARNRYPEPEAREALVRVQAALALFFYCLSTVFYCFYAKTDEFGRRCTTVSIGSVLIGG